MHKIKIFLTLLIVHCTLLIGEATAQWWVQGGNLLWPYGDVTIQKDLNVGMNLTVNDSILFPNDYSSIVPYVLIEDDSPVEAGVRLNATLNGTGSLTLTQETFALNDNLGDLYLTMSKSYLQYGRISDNDMIMIDVSNTKNNIMLKNSVSEYARIYVGSGTPEGSVGSTVGSIYLRTDGGAGTTLYVKESGGSTTSGWVGK